MKKLFLILTAVLTVCVFTGCKETPEIVWNIEAQASGEGKITVEYPTGNPGLVVEGNATATATTVSDTTANVVAIPNSALFANEIIGNPKAYSKQEVEDAEKLVNEVENAVKFHAEGDWKASVTGYAKYNHIYFMIDEHWPVDTVRVE